MISKTKYTVLIITNIIRKLEDRDWISNLVRMTLEELPEPKPKKRKIPTKPIGKV
jgi:hypothetical protein